MPKLEKDSKERNLYKLPKTGDYCVRKYQDGQERFKNLRTKNRREALRLKDETLKEWAHIKPEAGRVPFRQMALEFLEVIMGKAPKTILDFEGHLRLHLMPFFGHGYLDDVPKRWAAYKAFERKENPKRKLTHDRKHLIQIFKYAETQGHVIGVPKLPLDLQDRHVTPGRVFSIADFWKLHSAANPKWKLIIEMAAIMGMRRKEICTLEWVDIDFAQQKIILPAFKTKTRDGRVFPVEKSILHTLAARKLKTPSPWVFPNRKTPLRSMEPSDRTWQRIQKRSKVSGKFHWLRHSNVTWSLKDGHSASLIAKARGMSTKVLDRIYAHASTEDAEAMNAGVRSMLERGGRNNSGKLSGAGKKSHAN